MRTRFPPMASERTFVMFRFCLCSHESSLRRKEKIISRALADPGGLLRKLLRQRFALGYLRSRLLTSPFVFRYLKLFASFVEQASSCPHFGTPRRFFNRL